jgi:hypothetical protein
MAGLPGVCLTLAYFASVMRDTTHISYPVALDPSRTRLTEMAKSPAGVRMGIVLDHLDGSHACAVCDLSRDRRARP